MCKTFHVNIDGYVFCHNYGCTLHKKNRIFLFEPTPPQLYYKKGDNSDIRRKKYDKVIFKNNVLLKQNV